MLTQENAEALASTVMDEARKQAHHAREARARGVPMPYRVAGIARLSKWEQDELLREATKRTKTSIANRVLGAAWSLLCLGVLYVLRDQLGLSLALFFCLSLFGTSVIMWLSIRKHLRHLMEDQLGKAQRSAA